MANEKEDAKADDARYFAAKHAAIDRWLELLPDVKPCPVSYGFDAGYAAGRAEVEAERQLKFAIQQFTGFAEAVKGRADVIDLADSMGLTKAEYKKIRPEIQWLRPTDLAELDEHFNEGRMFVNAE